MTQEQEETVSRKNGRYMPPEIMEKIALNLPVKSLLRFYFPLRLCGVEISEPRFVKRYRDCAALPGLETIVLKPSQCKYLKDASCCPLSSISDQPIRNAPKLFIPFGGNPCLHASCYELWCVQVENSLFLWNPSLGDTEGNYKGLPDPSPSAGFSINSFVYGLGYDSVKDDYKILKILLPNLHYNPQNPQETQLYSLRNDSWKRIEPLPGKLSRHKKGVFVSGSLHWMVCRSTDGSQVIKSFDLSTEKYADVAQPEYSPRPEPRDTVKVTVLRGKLCVYLNYHSHNKFVLWVMKDYGVKKSWTKLFDFDYHNADPNFTHIKMKPLYFYDNDDILIKINILRTDSRIFLYNGKGSILREIVYSDNRKICGGFIYVDSLISPAEFGKKNSQPH